MAKDWKYAGSQNAFRSWNSAAAKGTHYTPMTAILSSNQPLFSQLQTQLTRIYALPESEDVCQFLIDTETYLRYSNATLPDSEEREKLFLRCHEDNSVDLGLY